MSNPYGPKIETTEDWNEALACCCQMPVTPEPAMLCESVHVTVQVGLVFYDSAGKPWLKYIRTSNGATSESTTSNLYNPGGSYSFSLEGATFTDYELVVTDNRTETEEISPPLRVTKCGSTTYQTNTKTLAGSMTRTETRRGGYVDTSSGSPNFQTHLDQTEVITRIPVSGEWQRYISLTESVATNDYPWTFSTPTTTNSGPFGSLNSLDSPTQAFEDPLAPDAARSEFLSQIGGTSFTECAASNGESCVAAYSENSYVIAGFGQYITSAYGSKTRYRWRVPESHLGSYYKITWDVVYEPDGWDNASLPEAERPLRFSRKNLTVEWEGPGSGDQSDPSWLAGGWYDLAVPEQPGVRKVINVRFEHLRKEGA